MKPGDVINCPTCGREATAYTTGDPAAWTPDRPLLVSWEGYRHEVLRGAPASCLFCDDGSQPRKAPSRRVAILDELARHGCRTDGFEWNTDDLVDRAHQRWVAAGRPRCVLVSVSSAGEGPLNVGNPPPPQADGSGGNKAPLEHSRAQLGLFG